MCQELELRKTPASISRGRRKDSKTSERSFEFPVDDDDGICIEDAIGDAELRTDIQEDTTKTVIRKRAFGMSKGSASGSKVQTNSKRHKADAAAAEGLIDYHALMEESERKTQGNDKSFDFVLDEDEEDADAVNHPQASGFLEDQPHIIVLTHSEAARMGDIVHELSPRYVILYDADVELVRSLEVHAATSALPIRIYMLVYGTIEYFKQPSFLTVFYYRRGQLGGTSVRQQAVSGEEGLRKLDLHQGQHGDLPPGPRGGLGQGTPGRHGGVNGYSNQSYGQQRSRSGAEQ